MTYSTKWNNAKENVMDKKSKTTDAEVLKGYVRLPCYFQKTLLLHMTLKNGQEVGVVSVCKSKLSLWYVFLIDLW